MTRKDYDSLLETVRAGRGAEYNGRSAVTEDDVAFIAMAEGFDPQAADPVDFEDLCHAKDQEIKALTTENAKLKAALKKLNDKAAKDAEEAKAQKAADQAAKDAEPNPDGEKSEGDGGQE